MNLGVTVETSMTMMLCLHNRHYYFYYTTYITRYLVLSHLYITPWQTYSIKLNLNFLEASCHAEVNALFTHTYLPLSE